MLQGAKFRKEQVHPSVWIAPGAHVMGDVTLAEQASVWFGAVLRGDTEPIRVGPGTNIQENCILHADPGFPCTVGAGCTLGHAAIVHGATVGDNVVIGMGSIVQNGASIGSDSIVAAGAVVTEGMEVPPGSLVMGVPARVRRPLTEQEILRNQLGAAHYVEASQQFAAAEHDAVDE